MRTCLPVVMSLALASAVPATASPTRYHVGRRVYGCVDSAAALALDRPGRRQDGLDWMRTVRQSGRCFMLWPALPLDVISRRAGLALVRRVPPHVGEPPLFVLERDVRTLAPPSLPQPIPPAAARPVQGPAAPPLVAGAPIVVAAGNGTGPGTPAGAVGGGEEVQEPANPVPVPVPVPDPGDRPAAAGSEPSPPPDAAPAPRPVEPHATVVPPVAAGAAAESTPSPVSAAPWPPLPRPPTSQLHRGVVLIGLGLVLLLIGALLAALIIARRRRHFAHVEEPADWPPEARDRVVELRPATAAAAPSAAEFRKHCAAALAGAGWATKIAFPGDGSGPDIVAQRDAVVAVIRCRASNTAVTGEMVDEAAAMGSRQGATMTLLASNAPFSQRARDEADRHGVRLLRDTELPGFTG